MMTKAAARDMQAAEVRVASIIDAVQDLDLETTEAWRDLDELSSETTVDGIHVDPVGVVLEDNKFNGLMVVFVALEYDESGDDKGFTTSDSFMGEFEGHFDDDGKAIIDKVTVDTSTFCD
jgi:hypothetical protein